MPDTIEPKHSLVVIVMAGAAAVGFRRHIGHETPACERSAFLSDHNDESLIPHTGGVPDRFGMLPNLKAPGFPEQRSHRFVARLGGGFDAAYSSGTIPGDDALAWTDRAHGG